MIAIVDYGCGNLHSIAGALGAIGAANRMVADPEALDTASHVLLPGVGAFGGAMERLEASGWTGAIRKAVEEGKPLLGICLGMQLLLDESDEGGRTAGLCLVPGKVKHLRELGCSHRVPHTGWNDITLRTDGSSLLSGIETGEDFYFVHSHAACPANADTTLASVDYGPAVAAIIGQGHVWGTQFHPEKSGPKGLQILRNFSQMRRPRPC